jgi:hypothetical protein
MGNEWAYEKINTMKLRNVKTPHIDWSFRCVH